MSCLSVEVPGDVLTLSAAGSVSLQQVVDGLSKNGDDKKGKIPSLIEERKALSEKKKEHVAAIREVQKKIKE